MYKNEIHGWSNIENDTETDDLQQASNFRRRVGKSMIFESVEKFCRKVVKYQELYGGFNAWFYRHFYGCFVRELG